MAEDKYIYEQQKADVVTDSDYILGVNANNENRLYKASSLRGESMGPYPGGVVPNPLVNKYYTLPGIPATYPNLLGAPDAQGVRQPISIAAPPAGKGIIDARAYWTGTYWLPDSGLVDIPTTKISYVPGKNLFNKAAITVGLLNLSGNGSINTATTNYYTSDFIPVSEALNYFGTSAAGGTAPLGMRRYVLFKANKTWHADGADTPTSKTSLTPALLAGASFVRFSGLVSNIDTFQFEAGTAATSYEAYGQKASAINDIPIKNADKEVYPTAETFSQAQVNALLAAKPNEIDGNGKIGRMKSVATGGQVETAGKTQDATAGYLTTGTGLPFVPNANYVTVRYPVVAGKDYRVFGIIIPADTAAYGTIWLNSSGALVTRNNAGVTTGETTVADNTLRTAPANAATLVMVGKVAANLKITEAEFIYPDPASSIDYNALSVRVAAMENGGFAMESNANGSILRLNSFQSGEYGLASNGNELGDNGYYKRNTGEFLTNDPNYSKGYPVTPGETVFITGDVQTADSALITLYSSNTPGTSSFKGFSNSGTGSLFSYVRREYVIPTSPSGINYLVVTSKTGYGKLERELVKKRAVQTSRKQSMGLIVVAFGDSNTETETRWVLNFKKAMQPAAFYNYALGGSRLTKSTYTYGNGTVVTTQNYSPDPALFAGMITPGDGNLTDPVVRQKHFNNCAVCHVQKFLYDLSQGTVPQPDFIPWMYGTNNEWSPDGTNQNLGSATTALVGKENLSQDDTFEMAKAERWCLQALQTACPNAIIIRFAPIQNASASKNVILLQKIEILKTISESLSIPFRNTFAECGISEKFEVANAPGRDTVDGTHANDSGSLKLARFIESSFKGVIL